MATRLLCTLVPASYYASKDKTLDKLHEYMAQELTSLFLDGIEVAVPWLHKGFEQSVWFAGVPRLSARILI